MGKLIVDGKNVYEVDEACLKRRKVPQECEIEAILRKEKEKKDHSLGVKR